MRNSAGWPAASLLLALAFSNGCGKATETRLKTYRMGEKVWAGAFSYEVTDSEWRRELGQGPTAKTPTFRFLAVHLSVFNNSSKDLVLPPLALVDDNDRLHTEFSDALADTQWLGLNRSVRGNESITGKLIFDVPPGHYRLRVADQTGEQTHALIDIAPQAPSEAAVPALQ